MKNATTILYDAPVIALVDAGIAKGDLGSDATIETADIVIQNDQPTKIFTAINIGRKTKTNRLAKHWVGIHSKSNCTGSWCRRFSHHVGSCFCRCWCGFISYFECS